MRNSLCSLNNFCYWGHQSWSLPFSFRILGLHLLLLAFRHRRLVLFFGPWFISLIDSSKLPSFYLYIAFGYLFLTAILLYLTDNSYMFCIILLLICICQIISLIKCALDFLLLHLSDFSVLFLRNIMFLCVHWEQHYAIKFSTIDGKGNF